MSWKPEYVILLFASTLIDYFAALKMSKFDDKNKRKKYLFLSIVSNLSILFFFKYFNFFSNSLRYTFQQFSISFNTPYLELLLPIGISFYTLQSMGYSIDVYNNKIKPEKHFGIFALYVSFFPQLVAGPIEKAGRLIPQLYKKVDINYYGITYGLKIILAGFLLKVVIADRLAIVTDQVFNNITEYAGFPIIIASYFFTFQIYCDFFGYSLIAIGTAKLFGINLIKNFNRPFLSKSVREFWRRWHISLSQWVRDYLYIPLGGSKLGVYRTTFNLLIVFLIVGLWHGAAWTFVIWGGLQFLYITFPIVISNFNKSNSSKYKKINTKLLNFLKIFFTFNLITLSFIIFRSNSLNEAVYAFTHLFKGLSYKLLLTNLRLTTPNFIFLLFSLLVLMIIEVIQSKKSLISIINSMPLIIRWIIYILGILLLLLFGVYNETPFIYFQF